MVDVELAMIWLCMHEWICLAAASPWTSCLQICGHTSCNPATCKLTYKDNVCVCVLPNIPSKVFIFLKSSIHFSNHHLQKLRVTMQSDIQFNVYRQHVFDINIEYFYTVLCWQLSELLTLEPGDPDEEPVVAGVQLLFPNLEQCPDVLDEGVERWWVQFKCFLG